MVVDQAFFEQPKGADVFGNDLDDFDIWGMSTNMLNLEPEDEGKKKKKVRAPAVANSGTADNNNGSSSKSSSSKKTSSKAVGDQEAYLSPKIIKRQSVGSFVSPASARTKKTAKVVLSAQFTSVPKTALQGDRPKVKINRADLAISSPDDEKASVIPDKRRSRRESSVGELKTGSSKSRLTSTSEHKATSSKSSVPRRRNSVEERSGRRHSLSPESARKAVLSDQFAHAPSTALQGDRPKVQLKRADFPSLSLDDEDGKLPVIPDKRRSRRVSSTGELKTSGSKSRLTSTSELKATGSKSRLTSTSEHKAISSKASGSSKSSVPRRHNSVEERSGRRHSLSPESARKAVLSDQFAHAPSTALQGDRPKVQMRRADLPSLSLDDEDGKVPVVPDKRRSRRVSSIGELKTSGSKSRLTSTSELKASGSSKSSVPRRRNSVEDRSGRRHSLSPESARKAILSDQFAHAPSTALQGDRPKVQMKRADLPSLSLDDEDGKATVIPDKRRSRRVSSTMFESRDSLSTSEHGPRLGTKQSVASNRTHREARSIDRFSYAGGVAVAPETPLQRRLKVKASMNTKLMEEMNSSFMDFDMKLETKPPKETQPKAKLAAGRNKRVVETCKDQQLEEELNSSFVLFDAFLTERETSLKDVSEEGKPVRRKSEDF
jgi:hypothetical protein